MKRSNLCFIALFALLSEIVFSGVVYSEETESTPANPKLQIPVSGLLVLKNGVITQLHTKGYHSVKKQIPFTENSPFRIASNTKPDTKSNKYVIYSVGIETRLDKADVCRSSGPKSKTSNTV